ncbi:MAG: sensor domain-containing protein [Actinomycetota bacterium]|nr:sensor domain-containing protein [Actinomycetota bacterium]
MAMKSAAVAAGACLALVGCSSAPVDDRPTVQIAPAAQPAPAPVPIPLGGFLPSAEQLSALLNTGPDALMTPAVEGGPDLLLRSVAETQVMPAECVGAPYRLQQLVYQDSPVLSVASTSWSGGGFDAAPVSANVGVVQLASPAAARDFFAATADRWVGCNGQTVTLHRPGATPGELSRISDVTFTDSMVSATVLHASAGAGSPTGLRALGVAGDCIVDVEVLDPRPDADSGAAGAVTGAVLDGIAARR